MISSAQSIKLKLRYFNVLGQKKIFYRAPVDLDILEDFVFIYWLLPYF